MITGPQYTAMRALIRAAITSSLPAGAGVTDAEVLKFFAQYFYESRAAGTLRTSRQNLVPASLRAILAATDSDVSDFFVQLQTDAASQIALTNVRYVAIRDQFLRTVQTNMPIAGPTELTLDGLASYMAALPGTVTGFSYVTAPGIPNFSLFFSSPYQSVQGNLGMTYGATPLATGTTPPVGTLSGTLTGAPVPVTFTCTSAGVIGAAARFSASFDGGASQAMTGINPSVGVPVTLTGAGTGMSMAWAAGAAALDNVWKATCPALVDQSGNLKSFTQATAGQQPIIGAGLGGMASLIFDGVNDYLDSALAMVAPGTTARTQYAVLRILANAGGTACLFGGAGNQALVYSPPGTFTTQTLQFNGAGPGNLVTPALSTWYRMTQVNSNSVSDSLRFGSLATTGSNNGNSTVSAYSIGGMGNSQFSNVEVLMSHWMPGIVTSFAAADAALATLSGSISL